MTAQPMFDTNALAKDYGVTQELLDSIIKHAQADFSDDDMMAELHILRAIRRLRIDEKQAAQA